MGAKEDQLRQLREARLARKPNPYEDAARGRDPAPKSSGGGMNAHAEGASPSSGGNKPAGQKPADVVAHVPPETKRLFRRPLASEREQTLSYQKPWEAEGMSRRTWYRRRREKSQ